MMAEQVYKKIEYPVHQINDKLDCMTGITKIFLDYEFTKNEILEILESMLILNKNNI